MLKAIGNRLKSSALIASFIATGAAMGVVATPSVAQAKDATYRCISLYSCGVGENTCCKEGDGSAEYCSTTCPVIIT